MFNYDETKALAADGGNYLREGGYYPNSTITEATYLKGNEQSSFVSFRALCNGQEVAFQIYTKQKNGQEHFQANKIQSLMGLKGIRATTTQAVTVKSFGSDVEGFRINEFTNINIGLRLEKEEFYKLDGTVGYKFNILNFIGDNGKTITESLGGKEALTITIPIKDKVVKTEANNGSSSSVPPLDDNDMPF